MRKIYLCLALLGALHTISAQKDYCVKDISITYTTISIFTTDGKIYTWGQNSFGQAGTGNFQDQNTPYERPATPDFATVFHGLSHTVGLTKDGKIYGWGRNMRSQVGDGTIIDRNIPIQVGTDTDWRKVTAGIVHTIALKNNGTLWGWGNNSGCELHATPANPYPNDYYVQPIQLSPDNTWEDITAGGPRTFGIKKDGTLWARGRNSGYGLGIGFGENMCITNFTKIGTDTDWKKIFTSASGDFTLALKTNNTLWGWGDNVQGAVGNGTSTFVQSPVQIGADTWKDVATGQSYSVGIKSNGTLWGWGRGCWDSTGGIITPAHSLSPVQVGNDIDWVRVYGGHCVSLAQKADGSVWAWGGYGNIWSGGASTSSLQPLLMFQCPRASTSETGFELSDIILYPNPGDDKIFWAKNIPIEKVTIYDMSGKLVSLQNVSENSVNVSGLVTGSYLIKLESKDKLIYNSKFIKK